MSRQDTVRAASRRPRQNLIDLGERLALIICLAAMVAAFSALRPDTFFTWSNFSSILGSQAVLVVITLGLIVPLTANDFDLSIANVLTLSAMMIAVLNAQLGWPVWEAALAAIAMGLAVGAINAFFITYFRIHSLIVTLGVGTFLEGVTLWISGSMTISGIANSLIMR